MCRVIGEQIGSLLFGILLQHFASRIGIWPISAQNLIEAENFRRQCGDFTLECTELSVGV